MKEMGQRCIALTGALLVTALLCAPAHAAGEQADIEVLRPTFSPAGVPGVDDPERVKRLIKNTAFLDFRLVDYPPGGGGASNPTAAGGG